MASSAKPPPPSNPTAPADSREASDFDTKGLIGIKDWSTSPLGHPDRWPQSLWTALTFCLAAPIPTMLWWGPQLVLFYNDAARVMVGKDHPQTFGAAVRDRWPEMLEPLRAWVCCAAKSGADNCIDDRPLTVERCKIADVGHFSLCCTPIRLADEIAGVLIMALEATEKVESDPWSRLLEEHARVHELFMRAPAPLCVLRASDLMIEMANAPYLRLAGRSDLVGKTVKQVFSEPQAGDLAMRVATVVRTGEPVHAEAPVPECIDWAGVGVVEDSWWSSVYAPLSSADGTIDRILVFSHEVTGQVRARQETERLRDEAEAANRAKDEFLAMLGHELRNPLSPIVTALQLMRLRAGSEDVFVQERAIIERQVANLARLVDDLLDVSRITRGQIELRRAPIEAAVVVARAVEIASPLLEQRRHELVLDVSSTGLCIHGDEHRLAQVVSNLLTNASKYTQVGGRIEVSARREDDEVVLVVRDNGIGMRPDLIPQVFELFVQGKRELDRSQGGLGLGLAIVRNLVLLHGGWVTARSSGIGKGSEFTVRLPFHHIPMLQPVHAARRVDPPLDHEVRVLVVDDNLDGANTLADVLRTSGWAVQVAYDGPSALAEAARFSPDVALLDIGLPVMDGYELAARLRSIPGLSDLRLVAITGYGHSVHRERACAVGFDDYLVKPLDFTHVEETLRDLTAHG